MAREPLSGPTNPYHYALHCIGGRWKMTILHEMSTYGVIHFNQTLKVLPISEKVLSQQLKEMVQDGLVRRVVNGDTFPPTIDYELTPEGQRLMPALDALYVWSIREMDAKKIPIDTDALAVHKEEKYVDQLKDIMVANGVGPDAQRLPLKQKKG